MWLLIAAAAGTAEVGCALAGLWRDGEGAHHVVVILFEDMAVVDVGLGCVDAGGKVEAAAGDGERARVDLGGVLEPRAPLRRPESKSPEIAKERTEPARGASPEKPREDDFSMLIAATGQTRWTAPLLGCICRRLARILAHMRVYPSSRAKSEPS